MAPEVLMTAERENELYQMRVGGATFQQIADHTSIPLSTVWDAVNRVLVRLREQTMMLATDHRDMELERYDRLFAAHFRAAVGYTEKRYDATHGRDYEVRVPASARAADTCLSIMKQRAALLGLNVPQELGEYDFSGYTDAQLAAEARKLEREVADLIAEAERHAAGAGSAQGVESPPSAPEAADVP